MTQFATRIPEHFLRIAERRRAGVLAHNPREDAIPVVLASVLVTGGDQTWAKYTRILEHLPGEIPLAEKFDGNHRNIYDFARVGINSLDNLGAILLACDQAKTAIVVGDLIDPSPHQQGAARIKDKLDEDGNVEYRAMFKDSASRLMIFDVDDVPPPENFDFLSREKTIDLIRSHLPPKFKTVELLIALTTSHGVIVEDKPAMIRARVFALTDRDLTLRQKKELCRPLQAKKGGYLDLSAYSRAHVIYLGGNVGGATDPYAKMRYMRSPGDPHAVITDEDLEEYRNTPEGSKEEATRRRTGAIVTSSSIEELLTDLENPELPGLHDRILDTARRIADLDSVITGEDIWAMIEPRLEKHVSNAPSARAKQMRGRWHSDFKRTVLEARERSTGSKEAYPPLPPPPTMTVVEASAKVTETVERFFEHASAQAENRKDVLLKVTAGVGKTTQMLRSVAASVKKNPDIRVAFSVPSHELGEQVQRDAINLGIETGRYEGRERLCLLEGNAREDVDTLVSAGFDTAAFCKSICPLRGDCEFPAQEKRMNDKNLIIIAGPQVPVNSVPAYLRRKCKPLKSSYFDGAGNGYWILDEDDRMAAAFPDGEAIESPTADLPDHNFDILLADELVPQGLLHEETIPIKHLEVGVEPFDAEPTDEEIEAAGRLNAFLSLYDPAGDFAYFRDGGSIPSIERAQLAEDAQILFARANREEAKLVATLVTGLAPDDVQNDLRKHLKRRAKHFRRMKSLVFLTLCMKYLGEMIYDPDQESIKLIWRGEVHPHWAGVPTMIADATADPELVKLWWPQIEVVEALARDGAGVRRYFMDGGPTITTLRRAGKIEAASMRQLNALVDMFIWTGRTVGVVGSMETERAAGFDALRKKAVWAHYNALRGLNSMEGVDVLIAFSRSLPQPLALEQQARALFRRQDIPNTLEGWDRAKRWIWQRRRDGVLEMAQVDCYTHPSAEVRRLLDAIMSAELVQADARIRPVRRGMREVGGGMSVEDRVVILHATNHPVAGTVYDEQPGGVLSLADFDPETVNGMIRAAVSKGHAATSAAIWVEIIRRETGRDLNEESTRRVIVAEMKAYLTDVTNHALRLKNMWWSDRITSDSSVGTIRGITAFQVVADGARPVKSCAEAVAVAASESLFSDRKQISLRAAEIAEASGLNLTKVALRKAISRHFHCNNNDLHKV